jgi:uncharacterized repeat protein (TIGR03803 family)
MMRPKRFLAGFILRAVLLLSLAVAPDAWAAPKYKVLHAFTGGNDGGGLYGPLLLDVSGNLYGTTISGGPKGKGGTVFELSPGAKGAWTLKLLHNFCSQSGCRDGGGATAGLIFDPGGDLYGSTTSGGGPYTHGTVFEMKPNSAGWKFSVLHRFGHNDKAGGPFGGVIMDGAGNLYGVEGCAFELSPEAGGKWKERILHCFPAFNGDGWGGLDRPILDAVGNLYGITEGGGSSKDCGGGCGTAYELSPTSGGKWKEHILRSFGGGDAGPVGAAMDGSGSLYAATGGFNAGTVLRLTPGPGGHWKETILHRFHAGSGGSGPGAGVVFDKYGNLYGTTLYGGDPNCGCGVVYKLSPGSNGKWTYTVLHRFIGVDGAQPGANLILDDKGNLYGTTVTGGAGGYGVAFELTP